LKVVTVSFVAWKSDKFSERLYVHLIGLFPLVSTKRIRKIHSGLVHDVLVIRAVTTTDDRGIRYSCGFKSTLSPSAQVIIR